MSAIATVLARALLIAWCVLLTTTDLRTRRLPNLLTGTGAAAVLGYAAVTGRFMPALLGALLLAGPYLVVHLVVPSACGAGDVKLAVGLGAAAAQGGAAAWVWSALGAPVVTALFGGARSILRSPGGGVVPHGPAMCACTLAALGWVA
ncbi:prepilin peptidase [Nocardia sp. alder85J]|uniref:prepilin peptidase n=1 Tax=Nocardia sp. alder85J TaxID=2862949 RepID=UPI001CD3A42F|nr:prepilin peptidase [Nocardia sp. alder85J]MCX4091190.1 prepilin peptidase [Nocardia sp. alder85J]